MFKSEDLNQFELGFHDQYDIEKENEKFDEIFNGNRYALITYDKFIYEYEDSEIDNYRQPIINALNDSRFQGIIKDNGAVSVIIFKKGNSWTNYCWKWDEFVSNNAERDYQKCLDRLIDRGYSYYKKIREAY